jgi:hypothetical protein
MRIINPTLPHVVEIVLFESTRQRRREFGTSKDGPAGAFEQRV